MKHLAWASTALLLFSIAHAFPQSIPPSQPTLVSRPSNGLSVTLDVVSPRPGQALTSSDLILTDNGHQIAPDQLKILPEHDSGAPAQLLLVIDAVNSSLQDVTRSSAAVASYLRQRGGPLLQPTTVLVLSDTELHSKDPAAASPSRTAVLHQRQLFVHRIPTTTDGNELAASLEDFTVGLTRILDSQAGNAVAERVRLSLEALSYISTAEASAPGAKVTVWLSPGWPFLVKSDAKSSEQLFDSIVYFSDVLRSSRMILHMVNPQGVTNQDHSAQTEAFLLASRPGSIQAAGHAPEIPEQIGQEYYKEFVKGVQAPKQSNPNDLSLQVLAIQSGGSVTQQNNDLDGQIARCATDVSNLTALSYTPQQSGGTTTYHAIQVKTTHPSQALRTRTGFYTR